MAPVASEEPLQNVYMESFNGNFRDYCLNAQWFSTLTEERAVTEWRWDYKEVRPYGNSELMPPAKSLRAAPDIE